MVVRCGEKTAGRAWCDWVRLKLGAVGETRGLMKAAQPVHVPVLGRWLHEHSWSWQLVAWREGGELMIGKSAGSDKGMLVVDVLEQWSWERYEAEMGGPKAAWRSTIMSKERFSRGQDGRMLQDSIWTWAGLAVAPLAARTLAPNEAWPVEAERWELLETDIAKVMFRVHDFGDEEEDERNALECKGVGEAAVPRWSKEMVVQLVGAYSRGANWQGLLGLNDRPTWENSLEVFTDDGVDWAGTSSAVGQMGIMVGWRKGESVEVVAEAGGVCACPAEWMTSHRAELTGVIAAVALLYVWAEYRGQASLWLDNESVVTGCKLSLGAESAEGLFHGGRHIVKDKQEGYANRDAWMANRVDRDLWEVLENLVQTRITWSGKKVAAMIQVNWVKSHMDDKVPLEQLPWCEWGNVWADRICNELKKIAPNRVPLDLPRPTSWRLVIAGQEVVAPIRKVLSEVLRKRRLAMYFREKRGWGAEADKWLEGGVPAYWLMKGITVGRKVLLTKYTYALLWTDDVVAERWLDTKVDGAVRSRTDPDYRELVRCTMCGEQAERSGHGSRN
jgi:ribonuclease HI